MKYSLSTIFALAIAATASPTPGGGENTFVSGGYGNVNGYPGEGLRMQHVYCTDSSNVILVGIAVTPVLNTRIIAVNRGINLSSGYGLALRNDADQFCQTNENVHGVFGCSQMMEVRNMMTNS